jgi:hypothetical protein
MIIKINIHVLFSVSELSSLVYQTKKMVEDARLYTWQLRQYSIRNTYSPDVHCKELLPCQLICYQLLHWPTKSQQTAFSPCHRRYLGENKTTDKCKNWEPNLLPIFPMSTVGFIKVHQLILAPLGTQVCHLPLLRNQNLLVQQKRACESC